MDRSLIIYHRDDLDGVCSAALLRIFISTVVEGDYKIDLRGMSYGNPEPTVDECKGYNRVFMADFSFKDTTGFFKELLNEGCICYWFDHHKTSIGRENVPEEVLGVREVGKAACRLIHEYFWGNKHENLIVEYLSAYDVWGKKTYYWDEVMQFQYGMRTRVGLSVKEMENYLRWYWWDEGCERQMKFLETVCNEGRVILKANAQRNESELKIFSFVADVFGYRALMMNTTEFNSTTFEPLYDPEKHDIMVPFCVRPDGTVRVSFYTTKDIDCSEIAKQFGGGGHAKAAGATWKFDHLLWFVRVKKIEEDAED